MLKLLNRVLQRNYISNITRSPSFKSNLPVGTLLLKCNKDDSNRSDRTVFRYLLYMLSGVIGYNYYKNGKVLPIVEAATNLSGRRGKHNFIADVVEQAAPAVVYIEIKDVGCLDFFTGRPTTTSNGSGFIVEPNGLIVTNAHVVINKPSSRVEVRLQNGKTYIGIVEAVDMQSDLALVRIPAKDLPIMKLGSSRDMRPGEFVVAMGSPLSLSNTVTSGVISSTNRGSDELGLRGRDMVYIQTDAAITFGNSGGPLINLDGEAIGVNSMKVTAGISFAIPIDYVKTFLKKAQSVKKSSTKIDNRRYMGITMLTLTPQIVNELHQRDHHIPTYLRHGILVWKVIIGSPAHAGGLEPGDIVTDINGRAISHVNEIYEMLADKNIKSLAMTVIRQGQTFQIKITPEDVS